MKNLKVRGNGTGTAYKRGRTWTAKVVLGWKEKDGRSIPVVRTKGGFRTKTEALKYCATLKENPNVPRGTETFVRVYERWKVEYEGRIAESTLACYKAAWKYFEPVYYRRISELTVSELQACLDACSCGRSTLDDMRTVCSLVYKYAIQNNLTEKNPARFLYTGRERKGTRAAFTAEELEKIHQAVYILPWADYVYCMCYLGFRPNEMLSLKKSAYDADHNCLIGGFKTEAGTDRIVPISPKIQDIIDIQLSLPGEYLFPQRDGSLMTDQHFRKYCFVPLMEQLGITGRVPYSCRHTFANLLKNVAGSDTDKAALIGHADASMTKYYQSADYESLRAITDLI